jgi:hypothetical protein
MGPTVQNIGVHTCVVTPSCGSEPAESLPHRMISMWIRHILEAAKPDCIQPMLDSLQDVCQQDYGDVWDVFKVQ